MSDELKPCPFCKSRSNIKLVEYRPNCSGAVVCGQCGARGPKKKNDHERGWKAKAIEAWNTRVAVTDEQFAMAVHDGEAWQKVRECEWYPEHDGENFTTECGAMFFWEPPTPPYCPHCGGRVKVVG